jgi:hypothetical protein
VPELIGESHVADILDFYKANVEVHEFFYAFWRRKFVRHFDEYNNCSHEGTNSGMKRQAAPSRPLHSIQKSIDVQIQQASISCATNEKSTQLMIDKQILWSKLPTKDRLNNRGESLVTEQWQLSTDYEVQRSSKVDWKVVDKATKKKTDLGPIPVFRRVRTVSVLSSGRLQCTCCLFERHGYGCRHMLSVLRTELPSYRGFEAEDVSVHWWSLYYHFGERPKISPELTLMLRELHRKDIGGPMLPQLEEILDRWPPTAVEVVAQQFVEKPAHQRVTNYTTAHVEGLVNNCNISTVGLNLSQISVNYRSDVDSDHVEYDLTGASTEDDEEGQPDSFLTQESHFHSKKSACIDFPRPELKCNWKETNAFQAVGPFMKEYLDLLELDPHKESKVKSLVSVMSDLIVDLKKDQLKRLGINRNKGKRHVSCSVAHDKRRRVEIIPQKKRKFNQTLIL